MQQSPNACDECAANDDPNEVPVHPGCECQVVTTGVDLGLSTAAQESLLEEARQGGFTFSPVSEDFPTSGFSISPYPDRSLIVPTSEFRYDDARVFVERNQDLFIRDGHYLGGWREIDPEKNIDRIWLDVSIVADTQEAGIELARQYNQVAIYDLAEGRVIETGGTGEAPEDTRSANAKRLHRFVLSPGAPSPGDVSLLWRALVKGASQ